MPKTAINPPGFPKPLAPYSSGTKADGVVYVSGTLAIDPDGSFASVGDAAGGPLLHPVRSGETGIPGGDRQCRSCRKALKHSTWTGWP
jgi:hypothetical protein